MPVPGGRANDVAGPQLVLLALGAALGLAAATATSCKRRRALEDDEDLLLLGVAVRDRSPSSRERCRSHANPASSVPSKPAQVWLPLALELDLVDVPDVLGARLRVADLERRAGGLDVPRVVVPSLDPRPADADRPRARKPRNLRRVPRAEHEELEPVGTCDERVLEVVGRLDHAVARPHLVHIAVLPREAGAGEHEVDLLRRPMRVRRGRELARGDFDAVQPDPDRAGRLAERLPHGVHLAVGVPALVDVVPVREAHVSSLRTRLCA